MSSTRDLVSAAISAARQLVGELALLFDGGQHRAPAFVHLPQIGQPLLEGPQLPVIEAAGHLFAVPRDERHSGAFVEQPHSGSDLTLRHSQFLSETGIYRLHG